MTTRIAVASLGTVGRVIAQRISETLPSYRLVSVTARRPERAREFLQAHGIDAEVIAPDRISEDADVVVECAPAQVYRQIAEPTLRAGKTLVTLSVGIERLAVDPAVHPGRAHALDVVWNMAFDGGTAAVIGFIAGTALGAGWAMGLAAAGVAVVLVVGLASRAGARAQ